MSESEWSLAQQRDGLIAERDKLRAEVERLKETNTRLNRRCQDAESAARVTVEKIEREGRSFGRALGAWAAGDYKRKLEGAERLYKESQCQVRELRVRLEELADLMDDVRDGEYTPDTFTTQPARDALNRISVECPRCGKQVTGAHTCKAKSDKTNNSSKTMKVAGQTIPEPPEAGAPCPGGFWCFCGEDKH